MHENDLIFVLKKNQDAELIHFWETNLDRLSENFAQSCKRLVSIHFFRMGGTEATAFPTILINTSQVLGVVDQEAVRSVISKMFTNYNLSLPVNVVHIAFKQASLRRSVDHHTSALPPICRPRNVIFSNVPETGASIGIEGSLQDTATLGCYLSVNGLPMVLTVDHLLPDRDQPWNGLVNITHLSEQDRLELLAPVLKELISSNSQVINHSCSLCTYLKDVQFASFDEANFLASYDTFLHRFDGGRTCSLFQRLLSKSIGNMKVPETSALGSFHARSGRGWTSFPLRERKYRREMDWALFEVLDVRKSELLIHHSPRISEVRELYSTPIDPGALIRSLGRTSGHQVGQINETTSLVFQEEWPSIRYYTREWCVLRRPDTEIQDWEAGGIGVDGDSGGIIVDERYNGIYGMLWGRIVDGPNTLCIFTPLLDIFDDISDRKRGTSICLLPGQRMSQPIQQLFSDLPAGMLEREERTPGMLPITENQPSNELDETPVQGVRRLSSIETGNPRPFERYRGHDRSNHGVPRNVQNRTSEDAEQSGSRLFPGAHTYFRYTIAPEED